MPPLKDTPDLQRASRNTPLGAALRRHWLPVADAATAPAPGAPARWMRVLTENLVLFTTHDGRMGVLDAYCPHEGGSLTNGTNVDGALQCMLHGWAFDPDGLRVDAGVRHARVSTRTTAYPVAVHAGRVWVYMGPAEHQPPAPGD